MENERKKPKTKPTSVSLDQQIKVAAKKRAEDLCDGNLTAYVQELIRRDAAMGLPAWAEPFEALLPRIREIVREEIKAALIAPGSRKILKKAGP